MGSNLKTYTVEELVKLGALEKPLDGNHGGIHPKSSEFVTEGVPFIMASDMKNGKIDTRNCKFISEDQARGLRKGFAKEGDVLLSHKATIGRTAIVDSIDTDFIVLTPQVTYYRVKDLGVINPKYLKYYFDSVKFQSLFEQWAGGGSTRLYLGITGQMKLPIELPDIETQNSIASIISDYDLKLLLNRQTSQTLEQMAQALFKSWFVDFDPVFDNLLASVDFKLENLETSLPDELKQKAQRRLAALNSLENAAEYKASLSALAHELQAQLPTKEATKVATKEATKEAIQSATQSAVQAAETPVKANFNTNPKILAQHANTHAHFPNEFEHNEQLGWIPKGWTLELISSFGEVVCGKTPSKKKSEFYGDEIPFIKIPDMHNNVFTVKTIDNLSLAGDNSQPKKRIPKDSICVSSIATVGLVTITTKQSHTNQQINSIIPKDNSFRDYLYFSMMNLNKTFHDLASGGSATLNMNTSSFSKVLVRMPSVELIKRFDSETRPLFNKIHKNMENNIALTNLRDTLLPKLISGELQIPDVATDEEVVD
jgi:type I restriction enzyme S subunit